MTNVKAALDTYCQALVNVTRVGASTYLSKVSEVIGKNYGSPGSLSTSERLTGNLPP